MKYFLAALITLVLITEHLYFNSENQSDFENWATKHNKFFSNSEKMYRMEIYYSIKKMIEEYNLKNDTTYQMGENQFMTLTHQEFIALIQQKKLQYPEVKENVNIPIIQQAVDWRNYVRVKDQGTAFNGWAFSVTNSMEAYCAIKKSQWVEVSDQISSRLLHQYTPIRRLIYKIKWVSEQQRIPLQCCHRDLQKSFWLFLHLQL